MEQRNLAAGQQTAIDTLITPPAADGVSRPFKNDICLPGSLYMLAGVQNNVFVEPLMKRWRPYNEVVRFSGSVRYSRRLRRVASVSAPEDGATLTISLINTDRFDTLKSLTSNIIVGTPGTGADTIRISIIGDSFTQGAFFKDALLVKGYVPKIRMTGLRDVAGFPGQFDEGRGGWTLLDYFSVSTGRTQSYNGFWQPHGPYRYWGATAFWKLANDIRLHPDTGWTFAEKYFAGRFSTRSVLFDAETGYKLRPAVNDIMFDNESRNYLRYDGKKWVRAAYNDYHWDFDYGKYLAMWQLKAPGILAEFLGLNDFRNATAPDKMDFSRWNAQMEKLIASYRKAVPEGRFVLMIPSSSCGTLDNEAGDFTTKQNAAMWELRKDIIGHFDHRESERVYIVDAAVAIDNVYGFHYTTDSVLTKPYGAYEGYGRIPVQTGNPHPYPNYPEMGVSLAAFIQRYR